MHSQTRGAFAIIDTVAKCCLKLCLCLMFRHSRFTPLTPTVPFWVQLAYNILCQTGLSLRF